MVIAVAWWLAGAAGLLALLVVGLAAWRVGAMSHRKIGGVTGDVMGASAQVGEVLALCLLAACT